MIALLAERDSLNQRLMVIQQAKATLQGQDTKAQVDKQRIFNEVEQLRQALVRLGDDKVDLSRQLGETKGQLALTQEGNVRLDTTIGNLNQTSVNLNNELGMLREVLTKLGQQK